MPACQVATYLDEIWAKKNFAGESGCPDAVTTFHGDLQ